MSTILILGGIHDAVILCNALYNKDKNIIHYALAGKTATPIKPNADFFVMHGFGGIDGLTHYIKDHHIDWLVDMTHPFATQMNHHAVAATTATNINSITYQRLPYARHDRDIWINCDTHAAAVMIIQQSLWLNIMLVGSKYIEHFYTILSEKKLWIRALSPSPEYKDKNIGFMPMSRDDAAPENVTFIRQFLLNNKIDCLVMKNSGGCRKKIIDIAQEQKIPIIMVKSPQKLGKIIVNDINDIVKAL